MRPAVPEGLEPLVLCGVVHRVELDTVGMAYYPDRYPYVAALEVSSASGIGQAVLSREECYQLAERLLMIAGPPPPH